MTMMHGMIEMERDVSRDVSLFPLSLDVNSCRSTDHHSDLRKEKPDKRERGVLNPPRADESSPIGGKLRLRKG